MQRHPITLDSSPGGGSIYSAKEFFTNNNPGGIVEATVFLNHVEPLTKNSKQKYAFFWELMKNNNNMLGIPIKRQDKNGLDYVWTEFEFPRGKVAFKTILLSDQLFDFLVKYQKAEVTVRFTLQELIDEALRIESGNPSAL